MNRNFLVWILLIILTLVSYFSSEPDTINFSIIALMTIALIKCCFVGFQFMELRKAHIIWRIGFISMIGLFALIIIALVISTNH